MTDDRIDEEDVLHVADLADVALEDDDLADFVDAFSEILDYFGTLDEVEEDVSFTDEDANVLRSDEVEEGLSQDAALSNAPETEDGYVRGPRVS